MNRIQMDDAPLKAFAGRMEALTQRLSDKAPAGDLNALRVQTETFKKKTADFFREERKLNIGVVGQVKAGKSSFLNTLLFIMKPLVPVSNLAHRTPLPPRKALAGRNKFTIS